MEKNISQNWVFFIDKNPCRDEYYDEGFGLYFWGWCLVGILLYRGKYKDAGLQIGIVVLNHAVGFWNDRGEGGE